MTDTRREEMFSHLAEFFPNGADPSRMRLYIKELKGFRFKIDDVREGIERVIHARKQATFPPLAEIVEQCKQARADRMVAERSAVAQGREIGEPAPRWNETQAEVENFLFLFNEMREQNFPRKQEPRGVTLAPRASQPVGLSPRRAGTPPEPTVSIDDYGGDFDADTIDF